MQVQESAKYFDDEYIKGYKLTDGLLVFLQEMKSYDIPVAYLSNDVLEWSVKLRKIHHLDKYISIWIISVAEGVRKPDAGIYRALVQQTGNSSNTCLFIDDLIKNLDTARRLGFKTLLFATDQSQNSPSEHNVVSSFNEIALLVWEQM
jgi:HAD superfamily hydrolase (TIGR01509 family)